MGNRDDTMHIFTCRIQGYAVCFTDCQKHVNKRVWKNVRPTATRVPKEFAINPRWVSTKMSDFFATNERKLMNLHVSIWFVDIPSRMKEWELGDDIYTSHNWINSLYLHNAFTHPNIKLRGWNSIWSNTTYRDFIRRNIQLMKPGKQKDILLQSTAFDTPRFAKSALESAFADATLWLLKCSATVYRNHHSDRMKNTVLSDDKSRSNKPRSLSNQKSTN
eukprot:893298_1